MANVFQKILAINNVEARQRTVAAIDWYRAKASNQQVTPTTMLQQGGDYKDNMMGSVFPGAMFLFGYDPKTKDTLPYYDTYPLVMPFEMTNDGFLGLNFHYLPPSLRAALLSNLASLKPRNQSEDIALSYQILNKYSKLSYFKPCVKRYLYSHVKSKFLYIEPDEWAIAIFLPLQRFQKSGSGTVYADSRRSLGLNIKGKKK